MSGALNWLVERAKEPSTKTGLGLILAGVAQMFPQYSMIILGLSTALGLRAMTQQG